MGLEGKSETKVSLKGTILTNQQVFDMIEKHKNNTENPHGVTAEQLIGLVPIEKGGTCAADARTATMNLGLGASAQFLTSVSTSQADFIVAAQKKAIELAKPYIPMKFPCSHQGRSYGWAEVFQYTDKCYHLALYGGEFGMKQYETVNSGETWNEWITPISAGGTGASNCVDAVSNMMNTAGESNWASSASGYPTKPGIYDIGNDKPTQNITEDYGMGSLLIFKGYWWTHILVSHNKNIIYVGITASTGEPSKWNKITTSWAT